MIQIRGAGGKGWWGGGGAGRESGQLTLLHQLHTNIPGETAPWNWQIGKNCPQSTVQSCADNHYNNKCWQFSPHKGLNLAPEAPKREGEGFQKDTNGFFWVENFLFWSFWNLLVKIFHDLRMKTPNLAFREEKNVTKCLSNILVLNLPAGVKLNHDLF